MERKGIGQEIAQQFLRIMLLRPKWEHGLLQGALAISAASQGTGRGTALQVKVQCTSETPPFAGVYCLC